MILNFSHSILATLTQSPTSRHFCNRFLRGCPRI